MIHVSRTAWVPMPAQVERGMCPGSWSLDATKMCVARESGRSAAWHQAASVWGVVQAPAREEEADVFLAALVMSSHLLRPQHYESGGDAIELRWRSGWEERAMRCRLASF